MIIVRIVQFVKIVQLVQLDYYGYIKFFGVFVGTWVGAFTIPEHMDDTDRSFLEDLHPWSPKLPEYIRKQKDRG